MNTICMTILCFILLMLPSKGVAQSERSGSTTSLVSASRYFQLTLDLKFGTFAGQQPTTQTITTEVAVRAGRPGSCRARMISQVPTGAGSNTKYLELGTKLDCNDVHIEGDGLALQIALETSRIAEMIKTKTTSGSEIKEPLITQRTVQLTVKLPLNQPKVIFNSSSHALMPQNEKSFSEQAPAGAPSEISSSLGQDPPMLIEITASELK